MISKKDRFSMLFFLLIHIGLAQVMNKVSLIATLHAWGALALGLVWALNGRLPRVAMICSYIAGCEVLWRMNRAVMLWEFGKYAVSLIMLLTLFRRPPKGALLPILFLLLLVPSCFISTVGFADFTAFRKELSFNMSGPVALTVSVLFWSRIKLTQEEFHKMIIIIVGPIVGIASIAARKIHEMGEIHFGTESNAAMSGGYAANQVSAILGLGALLLFFYFIKSKKGSKKITAFIIMSWLAVQSSLTFSRAGLYGTAIGIFFASLFLLQNSKTRNQFIIIAIIGAAVYQFAAAPYLDKFTGGALQARFQKTKMTGREELMQTDMQLWKDNPLLGVGAGQSVYFHSLGEHEKVASHTEFTRLVAEHGSLGFLAILMLIFMAISFFRKARNAQTRALVLATTSWTLSFMVAAAMRIVAPSFIFGLGAVTLLPEQPPFYPKFYPKPLPNFLPETPVVPPVRP